MNFTTFRASTEASQASVDVTPANADGSKFRSPEIRARRFDGLLGLLADAENLLSHDEQEQLQHLGTILEYRRGSTIFSAGEAGQFVYLIEEGIVRIGCYAENGHRQILAFKLSGDFFGLPDCGHYANSAETVSAARLYRFPWQRMLQIISSEPHLQLTLLAKFACDCSIAERRIIVLGQQNIRQRLASFMLELVQRAEFFDATRSRLKIPINRFDLADYLGTSPESAARAFAKLEAEGLVKRIGYHAVDILDMEGLEALPHGRRRTDCPAVSKLHA